MYLIKTWYGKTAAAALFALLLSVGLPAMKAEQAGAATVRTSLWTTTIMFDRRETRIIDDTPSIAVDAICLSGVTVPVLAIPMAVCAAIVTVKAAQLEWAANRARDTNTCVVLKVPNWTIGRPDMTLIYSYFWYEGPGCR